MKDDQRAICRKLRILNHAQEIGSVVPKESLLSMFPVENRLVLRRH